MPELRASSSASARRGLRPGRRTVRLVLFLLGPLVVAAAAGYFYVTSGRYVSTDNAYIRAPKVSISAEVSGRVVEVAVTENQAVEAGALLFRLDDRPFRIALARASGNLESVRDEIDALRASYRQTQEELNLARTNVAFFEQRFERQQRLAAQTIIAREQLDEARHNLDVARRQVAALEEQLSGTLARLGGHLDLPVEEHPRVREALAQRDQAALDLAHAVVTAPAAGIVSQVDQLRPGDYVESGTPVLSLVETGRLWVEANFKETQLAHVRRGEPATVTVDTYPGHVWAAVVESVSPATGAEFSLLPPQNATGNWVKVVQRIPVRLAIETRDGEPPLRAGMSVTVEIDTGRSPRMPRFVRAALAWIREDR